MRKIFYKTIFKLSKKWPFKQMFKFIIRFPGLPNNGTNPTKILKIATKLQLGDLIFSHNPSLFSLLIPGDVTHVGVYIGGDDVAEMLPNGFHYNTIWNFCRRNKRVIVCRCNDFNQVYVTRFINNINQFKFHKYDFSFNFDVMELYCSEMVYLADDKRVIKCSLEDNLGVGQKFITPQGLLNASNISIIYDTDN